MKTDFQFSGAIATLVSLVPQRNATPLTPALSPLRGEGVALSAHRKLVACRRVRFVPDWIGTNNRDTTGAADGVPRTKAVRRAPSPLNGERAGVRGEAVR